MFSYLSRLMTSPVESFHKSATRPKQPDARSSPFGLNATDVTLLRCPLNVRASRPVSRSQSLTMASSPPEANQRPFAPGDGLMASEAMPLAWPVRTLVVNPVETLHNLMVLSQPPETIV